MSATLISYKSVDQQFHYRLTGHNYCGYLIEADGEEKDLLDAYIAANPYNNKPHAYDLGDGTYAVSGKFIKRFGLA